MRGRPLHIDWHPEDTVEALHDAYRAATDAAVKPRLHALWLLRTGKTMAAVAPLVGFVYRTVQDWVARYRAGGRAGLATTLAPPPPPPSHLTPAQWDEVRQHLRAGTTRTVDQLRHWMARTFGVTWSYEGLRKALQRSPPWTQRGDAHRLGAGQRVATQAGQEPGAGQRRLATAGRTQHGQKPQPPWLIEKRATASPQRIALGLATKE